ncbi:MAG TPA: serine/threonine-protein kinase [Kofleriaceae bacterium]|nr:serine/threonine-protein kinase [Kofleriaceae bacterium]
MDCDDVMLLLARGGAVSDPAFDAHVAVCDGCSSLVADRTLRADDPVRKIALPAMDPTCFDIGEAIAAGGMGKITRAFDRRLGREVAIKEILSPELQARFEREAAITARLQHPAIVPIYEAGTWPDGRAFYTMRLVSGGTLAAAIERCRSLEERLALLPHLIAVTDAIAYAHARGVIHRDLKPQNVLIGEFGETVVIDWGLAKEHARPDDDAAAGTPSDAQLTHAGAVFGTPCFMSPEQARGEELDARADVYALGAMLYNLITGTPPYWADGRDGKAVIAAVLDGPPRPIVELAPRVPADVRAIIERAMARDLAERYRDARQLADELRRFQAGQLLVSRRYPVRERIARWVRRHRTLVLAAAALAIVAGVAIVLVATARDAEREQRTIAERALEIGEKRGQRKLCAASAPALASPWDAAAKDAVHRAFAAKQLAYGPQTLERVDANLDRWTAELGAARDAACDEESTAPADQLAAKLACLADRAREGRALISQFQDADEATVLNAVGATEGLAPIARCTTPPAGPRGVLADSPAVERVRQAFARTHALMDLGKFRDALPLAKQAVGDADAIGDPGLRAQARVALGSSQAGTSDLAGASKTLGEALHLAELAHDDRARAQAWTNLVRGEYYQGHFAQAVLLRDPAVGAAERIGDGWLQSEILLNVGGSLDQLGRSAEAQALYEQAVAMRKKLYGERDRRTAFALSALGNAYAMQGKLDAGIAAHRDAVVIAEAALGASHPTVGVMHGNLGDDYVYGLRPLDGIAELEKDLAAVEAAHGAKHRDVAMALTDLGIARLEAGQHDRALETFTRAAAAWRDVNPKHPALAEALLGTYLASKALGKPANVRDLEPALELAKGLPPFERARVQLAIGTASTGPRAIELVKAAAAGFATSTLPLCQRELAEAQRWLAAHGVSAAPPARTP